LNAAQLGYGWVMNACATNIRTLTVAALVGMLAVSACGSDDDRPTDTVVDELDSDADVPFDNDVAPGVDTDTDEGNNLGFDDDAPGPVGNQTDVND
jgi:hypothetical protein